MLFFTEKTRVFSSSVYTVLHLGALALSGTLLSARATQAQVNLSPMKIEVQNNRGQAQGVINITNTSSETFRARVYAESFTYHRDSGFQQLSSSPTDLRPYLQFSPRELVVPPGTTRRVRLNTRLAPNLPNGEYRAMIFTEPLKQQSISDAKGGTTKIITRVGTAFFVRKGNVSPNLTVDSAMWNSRAKLIQLLVRNIGKASAYPTIKWTIKQGATVVKTGEIASMGIVPDSERNIVLNQSKKDELALSPGTYQLTGELIWGEDKDKKNQRFNINLTVPAQAATGRR
ncbi:hypothetical protein DSM106972_032380 [Dulcicalothrix desertica PCC 7102]|uniref:P pilus assembly protein, chaperone PapD n=1 Tax=Dulcicalothrix desertica PCC 7102 TaxID=232991 RepID=A0A433VIY4_9CYAN|nr:P pilus assembly protein, chaperone PapD [Dulcicalothrix desertica]RUT06032.1 hypothetical protein DSM106972_032380 [Dulcicalothrix desertica PCC 7102]TWH54301.1 hypothetical protein CAL7102_02320 [Dulcicalothrix desertica PCC 7102]